MATLEALLAEIGACQACAGALPHPPRPIVRVDARAKLLIAGQAPGRLVHETGLPWNDPSGDRLRDWMGVDRDWFYAPDNIAVAAMGFCFPGTVNGADLPPRPECAPLWRARLLSHLPNIRLTLVIGMYAARWHLPKARRKVSLTDTIATWREDAENVMVLPHPSWRNSAWLKRNPWFEAELVPLLRSRVRALSSCSL
jgi:uracil-DNA glycosylase